MMNYELQNREPQVQRGGDAPESGTAVSAVFMGETPMPRRYRVLCDVCGGSANKYLGGAYVAFFAMYAGAEGNYE